MKYQFQTTEKNSRLMKKIKSTNTKTEILLRKALWHKGIRYRKNYARLPGKPDIAITTKKIAIFIDGEFWHGFNWDDKKARIHANSDYWVPKIERNIVRDRINNQKLVDLGWTVIRFWETQVQKGLDDCLNIIIQAYSNK